MYAYAKRSLNVLATISAVLFAALLMPGSSFAATGSLETSGQVAKDTEAYSFNPDYDYYVLKEGGMYYAVMGLGKDYKPTCSFWTPVKMDPHKLQNAIGFVKSFPTKGGTVFGAYVKDPAGKTIGTWYSSLNVGLEIDGHNVVISSSQPWIGQ